MKSLAKSRRRRGRPTLQNGTVPPPMRFNRDVRSREYLTPKEVERLIAAAKKGGRRYGLRDATMILVAYRHGLRVSEPCALTWYQIDFSLVSSMCGASRTASPVCTSSGVKRCARCGP
jgi:type 1 fimbriae regulatory protein FimB/type 1 fimbriae regulatory protein FimE